MTKLQNDYQETSLNKSLEAIAESKRQKADLSQDAKDLEEGLFAGGTNPEPQITKITPQQRQATEEIMNPTKQTEEDLTLQAIPPTKITPEVSEEVQDDRLKGLYNSYGKENVDNMLQFQDVFPDGYSLEKALEDKQMYGNIYLQSLPSGFYIFRALTKGDLDYIRGIKGMDEDKMPNQIVETCVIFPKMTKYQIQGGSAGTVKTLTDLIYMYSDFMSQTTEAPLKL